MENLCQPEDCTYQLLKDCNNFLLTNPIWLDQVPDPVSFQNIPLPTTLLKISHHDAKFKINTKLSVDIKIPSKTFVADEIPPMKNLQIIIKKVNLKNYTSLKVYKISLSRARLTNSCRIHLKKVINADLYNNVKTINRFTDQETLTI